MVAGEHSAPIGFDRLLHDRQAESGSGGGPGGGRPIEAVEHPGQIRLRDPGAVIAPSHGSRFHPHFDLDAGWVPLAGVVEKVPQSSLELGGAHGHVVPGA